MKVQEIRRPSRLQGRIAEQSEPAAEDGTGLQEGDFAGICAYQGCYGAIALTKRNVQEIRRPSRLQGRIAEQSEPAADKQIDFIVQTMGTDNDTIEGDGDFGRLPTEYEAVPAPGPVVTLRTDADFSHGPRPRGPRS